jgi:hypothetical protein
MISADKVEQAKGAENPISDQMSRLHAAFGASQQRAAAGD